MLCNLDNNGCSKFASLFVSLHYAAVERHVDQWLVHLVATINYLIKLHKKLNSWLILYQVKQF